MIFNQNKNKYVDFIALIFFTLFFCIVYNLQNLNIIQKGDKNESL